MVGRLWVLRSTMYRVPGRQGLSRLWDVDRIGKLPKSA